MTARRAMAVIWNLKRGYRNSGSSHGVGCNPAPNAQRRGCLLTAALTYCHLDTHGPNIFVSRSIVRHHIPKVSDLALDKNQYCESIQSYRRILERMMINTWRGGQTLAAGDNGTKFSDRHLIQTKPGILSLDLALNATKQDFGNATERGWMEICDGNET